MEIPQNINQWIREDILREAPLAAPEKNPPANKKQAKEEIINE